jgi:hypothetical protein
LKKLKLHVKDRINGILSKHRTQFVHSH